jgi:hypothetical protein
LSAALLSSVGFSPWALTTGDFNGDGKIDLAVANAADDSVSVLLQASGGGLPTATAPSYPVERAPSGLAVGDINGDGRTDLVVANRTSGTLSVLLANANGTFRAAVSHPVGGFPSGIATGDFNGDGKVDIAVTSERDANVSVLINLCPL